MKLWIDTELYSPVDLKSVGVFRYAEDPATELTLVAYAVDDGPVQLWDVTLHPRVPEDLRSAFAGCGEIWAHNAQFDRTVLRAKAGLEAPIGAWRCSMTQAMAHGLPAGLDALGRALGLPEDTAKLADGRELVLMFCRPHHLYGRTLPYHKPEQWTRFKQYAVRDVEATRECVRRMPRVNYPDNPHELALYHLDQVINDRGLPMDRTLAVVAGNLARQVMRDYDERMARATEGAVGACSQVAAIKRWLAGRGLQVDSLDKAALDELLDRDDLPAGTREVLLLRQSANKTSTAKFNAIVGALGSDDRLRGTLMFLGASRTGRWSGKLFQPQNLPRGSVNGSEAVEAVLDGMAEVYYPEPLEALSAAVRGTVTASPGHKLVCADLSAIEGRVLAWLANEQWKVDAYAAGEDLYVLAYARAFNVPKWEVTKAQRQVGKVMELALGFQGGVGALQTMAAGYHLELPELEEQYAWVDAWRAANPEIVGFWYALDRAAQDAIARPGKTFGAGRLRVSVRRLGGEPYLMLKLPSGRYLMYHRPAVEYVEQPMRNHRTGEMETVRRRCVTFLDYGKGAARRHYTHGGKLAENATQATARDVLAWSMPDIEYARYSLVGTVHDEVITEVPDQPAFDPEMLSALLAAPAPWAEGLPLAAAGFEAKRYRK